MKFHAAVCLTFLLISSAVSLSFQNIPKAHCSLQVVNNRIKVHVYVVVLDGVEARDVDNISKVVDGVETACESLIRYNLSITLPFPREWQNVSSHFLRIEGAYVRASFMTNVSFHLVTQWNYYKDIVESEYDCVVVNAHGSVIPVPEGYSREEWVDKIAEAMQSRNLTWVHVGGYPFYYCQKQNANLETWGDKGLKQLMSHIGEPNLTCNTDNWAELTAVDLHLYILHDTWAYQDALYASETWRLPVSGFENLVAMPIWGLFDRNGSEPLTGAAIAFKESENQTSFGFYVHVGTNETRHGNGWKTDKDFERAHVGCATGLWCLVSRTAREIIISETEALIKEATYEGRTEGLDTAKNYLNEARIYDKRYGPTEFWDRIYKAMVSASNAAKPQTSSEESGVTSVAVAICFVAIGVIVVWQRRKNQDEGETLCTSENSQ
ncbi:MAG TPA: hypothetical protein VMT26_03665 [Candidatus Bathyarchaeia archaeon]|nr:hypothetical protein [Candidatus Bathyarchaeia archaeon]